MRSFSDVVFDLGGVLVDWDPRHLFVSHMGEDSAAVEEFLSRVCTPQWHARLDGGERFEAAATELARAFPGHAEWIDSYASRWEYMFAGPIADGVELLERCVERGLGLHALTNYPAEKIAFLYTRFPFMRSFDTVVVSGLLGRSKPEPAIYDYMLDRIGGRDCLFVDDRIENVRAARTRGFQALHFDRLRGPERLAVAIDTGRVPEDGA